MVERFLPKVPLGADGPYLAAILDVLDGIAAKLDHLTTPPPPEPDDEPVAIKEPAPKRAARPAKAASNGTAGPAAVAEPAPRKPTKTSTRRNGGTT